MGARSGSPCRIPAWVEYKKRTGKLITDSLAIEIAGHFLKTALESGEGLGREMYSLTIDETLKHLEGVVADVAARGCCDPTTCKAGVRATFAADLMASLISDMETMTEKSLIRRISG